MSSCDQVRRDLHLLHSKATLIIFFIFIIVVHVLIFTMSASVIFVVLAILAALLLVVPTNVIFFIVDARVLFFAVFLRPVNHPLHLELFFAHLVEAIFLIVAVSHDASNLLS